MTRRRRSAVPPDGDAEQVAHDALANLDAAIGAASPAGRPLFAANAELACPDDPVAALWLAATTFANTVATGTSRC